MDTEHGTVQICDSTTLYIVNHSLFPVHCSLFIVHCDVSRIFADHLTTYFLPPILYIKYPNTPPTVFNITSSTSALRLVKNMYCITSISVEKSKLYVNTEISFLLLIKNDVKKPKGRKSTKFPNIFLKETVKMEFAKRITSKGKYLKASKLIIPKFCICFA